MGLQHRGKRKHKNVFFGSLPSFNQLTFHSKSNSGMEVWNTGLETWLDVTIVLEIQNLILNNSV